MTRIGTLLAILEIAGYLAFLSGIAADSRGNCADFAPNRGDCWRNRIRFARIWADLAGQS